jgi:hypothetical protein
MYEVQGQVLSSTGKQTTKGIVYEIAMSDGQKYSTWDAALGTKAHGLQGQVVVARVEVEQKGQYTNYMLKEIGLVGQLAPLAQPAVPGTPVMGAVPMQAPGVPEVVKQTQIVRQNVLRTAFDFVGNAYAGAGPESLEEATAKALELASVLFKKVNQTAAQATPAPAVVPPTTPAEVAAEVPGVQVGTEGIAAPAAPTPEW